MSDEKIVIILGSEKDTDFIEPAVKLLKEFEINNEIHIGSAHKTPRKVLDILEKYEDRDEIVYLTVAGRSNALSGFVDANSTSPVIACPPYSDKFGGADIFSSLRMPSGVGPMVVLDPENAGLAAAKILALKNSEILEKISSYRKKLKNKIRKRK